MERLVYRLAGVDPKRVQRWDACARSLVGFSLASVPVLSTRPAGSTLFAVATMGTSAGVAISAPRQLHTARCAAAPGPILLGEVSPGGVGSGLYGILVFVLLAVFIGSQMVGRTPEYLGRKLRGRDMKVLTLSLMTLPVVILVGAATVVRSSALRSALDPGAHDFTEMLGAFASAANGNGSALAGVNSNTDWYNTLLALAMLAGRFLLIVPVLALAGSLSRGREHQPSLGTLPTSGPTLAVVLTGVVLITGGLTYLPALVLGPAAEHLSL